MTDHSPGFHDPTPPPPSPTNRSLTVVVVLSLVIVGCLGSLAYLFVARDTGDDRQSQRETVMSQAEQFMLRVNTYGPNLLDASGQMPEYRELVTEVITPKFEASFDEGVTAAESTVEQAGVGRTSKVYATGVSSLDADSAKVLVAGSFTVSYPDADAEEEDARIEVPEAVFRVEVSLVKTGGEWLVDDFVPVTGEEEADPGLLPTPSLPTPTTPVPTTPAPTSGESPS